MTGNADHAALALAGDLPILSDMGSTRMVYLYDNVVYKVNTGVWNYDANLEEFNIAQEISNVRTLPEGVYIPAVTLYSIEGHNVLAMEYIEGTAVAECYCAMANDVCTDTCMSDDVWQKVNGYLDDTSGFNTIITATGDIYIIDLA